MVFTDSHPLVKKKEKKKKKEKIHLVTKTNSFTGKNPIQFLK